MARTLSSRSALTSDSNRCAPRHARSPKCAVSAFYRASRVLTAVSPFGSPSSGLTVGAFAAANKRKVWVIKNADGTVDLSPIGRKGFFLVRDLTMPDAIDFLDNEFDPRQVGWERILMIFVAAP